MYCLTLAGCSMRASLERGRFKLTMGFIFPFCLVLLMTTSLVSDHVSVKRSCSQKSGLSMDDIMPLIVQPCQESCYNLSRPKLHTYSQSKFQAQVLKELFLNKVTILLTSFSGDTEPYESSGMSIPNWFWFDFRFTVCKKTIWYDVILIRSNLIKDLLECATFSGKSPTCFGYMKAGPCIEGGIYQGIFQNILSFDLLWMHILSQFVIHY